MTTFAVQCTIIVLLILLYGLFAMSETVLVSARKGGLRERADAGDKGARIALELADSPNRFLSTVQIGISLIGVLSGAVVASITYLTLILGELVPKRLALNGAETVASRVARPMRSLSTLTCPAVWFLGVSTDAALRLLGVRHSDT
jgi:putative hemolysin